MPEYLAPGVYIEEVEIGAKPIEGVSTSTCGFLGYAERGPLNKPVLMTSFADFELVFGGFLPAKKDGSDLGKIRWLAYAVSAFFENGGKRAYVTRVASGSAAAASGFLPGITGSGTRDVLSGSTAAKEQALQLSETAVFTVDNLILLEDGSRSEYLTYKGAAKKLPLHTQTTPLNGTYAAGTRLLVGKIDSSSVKGMSEDAEQAVSEFYIDSGSGFSIGNKLLIMDTTAKNREVVIVIDITPDTTTDKITTGEPLLFGHASGTSVYKVDVEEETTLIKDANADAAEVFVENSMGISGPGCFFFIEDEYWRITTPENAEDVYQVSPALKYGHDAGKDVISVNKEPALTVTASSRGTWGNSLKVSVIPSSISSTVLTNDVSNSKRLDLETITGIEAGSILKLTTTSDTYFVTVKETHKIDTDTYVDLETPFTGSLAIGDKVETQEFDLYISDGVNEEVFKHLSLKSEHSRFIENIVTEKSSNLAIVEKYTGPGGTIVFPTTDDGLGWFLNDGADGFPGSEMDMNVIYEGLDSTEPVDRTGLYTFKNVDEITIVGIPGVTTKYLQQKLITHCETAMKDRFAVLDSAALAGLDEVKAQRNLFDTSYASLYYPWVYAFDPLSKEYVNIPPSGYVCGIYARTDVERGVHKAPANQKVNGVVNTERLNGKYRIVDKGTQDILNPLGVNCIRSFPGRGIRVWGARTMSSNSLWKYVNVRRLFLYLEESIEKGTQWVVFEPNDEKLWARVKQTISQFLTSVWKSGALMGNTPEDAFFIKCDRTTMTQDDIDNGRLIVKIGVAPVKPAEFVVFRIAQWQGGSAATE